MHATVSDVLWEPKSSLLKQAVTIILGSLLLWASAKVQVPFHPVPITLQTLVVLGLGFVLGPKLAAATVILYLIEGAAGLPVFAGTPEKGIGVAYMVGPTGGYLVGFLLAAIVCGHLATKGWDRNPVFTAAGMLIGNAVIYIPGLLWLGAVVGWDKPVLEWGLTTFLLGDLTKLVLAAALLPVVWRVLKPKELKSELPG